MIQTGIVGSHTCFYSAKIYFVIPLFFNEPQGPEVEGLHGSRLMVGSVKPDGFVPEGERREEREISRIHVSKKKNNTLVAEDVLSISYSRYWMYFQIIYTSCD